MTVIESVVQQTLVTLVTLVTKVNAIENGLKCGLLLITSMPHSPYGTG